MNELQKEYLEQRAREQAEAEALEEARLKKVMEEERKKEAKRQEKEKKAKEEAEQKAEAEAIEILNRVKAEMAANKEKEEKKAAETKTDTKEAPDPEEEEDNIYDREPAGEAVMPKKSPKFKKGSRPGTPKSKEAAATREKEPKRTETDEGTPPEPKAGEEKEPKQTEAGEQEETGRETVRETKLREQLEEYQDKYKRLLAEFENARTREAKEATRMYDMGAKAVLEKLLPIVDNFERAILTIPEEDKERAFEQGVDKIYKQMMTTLEEIGVQPMNAQGTEFNPDMHNAVMHVEDEAYGENVVAEEMQKGYMYKDSVLRYSMVKVAN